MSDPPQLNGPITRAQFAQYVTGADGQPIEAVIQTLEAQQGTLTEDIPGEVAAAAATANDALAAANATNAKLQAARFLLTAADADIGQARTITAGSGITFTDAGAGGTFTVGQAQSIAILAADVSDITGALVNANNLAGVLEASSKYMVEGSLAFQSAALTTGLGLGFALPAGAAIVGGYSHPATATGSQSAYNNALGAPNANTTAVPAAVTTLPLTCRWVITTGVIPGTAQLQFRTGVAASAITLKANLSALIFRKIG